MKRTIVAVAVAMSISPVVAAGSQQINFYPPKIAEKTSFQPAVRTMSAMGWQLHSKKCYVGQTDDHVCSARFVNPCGTVATAFFFGEKEEYYSIEVGGIIKGVNISPLCH